MSEGKEPKPVTRSQFRDFFAILAECLEPKSELKWETPLDLLVAAVLSAQCTDKAVNQVTTGLWRVCRTPDNYITLGEAKLRDHIHSLGLYKNKARNLIGLCRLLRDEFGSRVPATREGLERLPGVGRKTANVVLNVVFRQPVLPVDTHIFRVANRTGMVKAKTPEATELALLKRIPAQYLRDAHHYLVLHGRYTCKARKPECWRCPVARCCNHVAKSPAP